MSNLILVGLFGCVLALVGTWAHARVVYWRSSYETVDANYAEATSLLIAAERDRARLDEDVKFYKLIVVGMTNQPSQVHITDQQLNQLCHMILSNMAPPEELN